MKALFIVLLILSVLALIPVGIDGGWATGQAFALNVRVGLIRIGILPKKEKEPKAPKPPKPAAPGEEKKKKKNPLEGISREGKKKLLRDLLQALGRFREKLKVQYLRFHYTVASSDPFKTAMGFGIASGAADTFVPLLDEALDIEERDIGPAFDFTAAKPRIDVWITASILLWQVLYIAGALGIDYLKIKKQYTTQAESATKADKRKD